MNRQSRVTLILGLAVWIVSILFARAAIRATGVESEFLTPGEAWGLALAWSPWMVALITGLFVIFCSLFGGGRRG